MSKFLPLAASSVVVLAHFAFVAARRLAVCHVLAPKLSPNMRRVKVQRPIEEQQQLRFITTILTCDDSSALCSRTDCSNLAARLERRGCLSGCVATSLVEAVISSCMSTGAPQMIIS